MKTQPVVLVTGATSGIGEAIAYRLQAKGYVVFAAGRNPAALDALRSRGLPGPRARRHGRGRGDPTRRRDQRRLRVVDILVDGAGIRFEALSSRRT